MIRWNKAPESRIAPGQIHNTNEHSHCSENSRDEQKNRGALLHPSPGQLASGLRILLHAKQPPSQPRSTPGSFSTDVPELLICQRFRYPTDKQIQPMNPHRITRGVGCPFYHRATINKHDGCLNRLSRQSGPLCCPPSFSSEAWGPQRS